MINSKENTMRILKGQFPIQKFRCRLGWHRWTSWEIIDRNPGHQEWVEYPIYAQCHCADCGMPRRELPVSKSKK